MTAIPDPILDAATDAYLAALVEHMPELYRTEKPGAFWTPSTRAVVRKSMAPALVAAEKAGERAA